MGMVLVVNSEVSMTAAYAAKPYGTRLQCENSV